MFPLINPFVIEGYAGPEYFCDREEETAELIQAMKGGRNVTLISPRRMGKSGLILNAFDQIKKTDREVETFYIDIFPTHNLSDFIQAFATTVFKALDNKLEKFLNRALGEFRHCRPVIYPDALSGMPTLSLEMASSEERPTLNDIFQYLKDSGRKVIIAFDEFQQISEYPETGIEALLRSHTQLTPNVTFIFSGSKRHLMQQMFTMPQRPFYQSTQTISLKEIPADKYFEFAKCHFAKAGKSLSAQAFDYIYQSVYGHTWYVQYWLSRAFELPKKDIQIDDAKQILKKILRSEDDNFYAYSKLLTQVQLSVLRAIALEGSISENIKMEFIKKHNLPAPSTVRSAIGNLVGKEFLLDERGRMSVYNRFFMLYLRYQYAPYQQP